LEVENFCFGKLFSVALFIKLSRDKKNVNKRPVVFFATQHQSKLFGRKPLQKNQHQVD